MSFFDRLFSNSPVFQLDSSFDSSLSTWQCALKPVRILAKVDKLWTIDPNPNVVQSMVGSKGSGEETIM